ncbi:MAG: hypothetical protein AB4290_13600 [Spirulina sp.]
MLRSEPSPVTSRPSMQIRQEDNVIRDRLNQKGEQCPPAIADINEPKRL